MNIVTIDDLRLAARRKLPKFVFDFVDGGAGDEVTLRRNRAAFERWTLEPRMLIDVSKRDQSTTLFGDRIDTPVLIAPTGGSGMVWPYGHVLAAKAAQHFNTVYILSTHSSDTIEEVAEGAKDGLRWFQLYVWRNREISEWFVDRAMKAGYRALVLTVDVPMASRRERDIRNGFVAPNWFTWRSRLDICLHPGWAWRQFRAPRRTLKNLEGIPGTGIKTDLKSLTRVSRDLLDPAVTWADLAWLRSKWPGPLLIKGILTADDARRAIDHGIDGIVVSNHGGRQLDSAPAAIEALPDVVAAVKGRAEILLDGGVRRGADVVKAVALGAKAVTVGRPHLFGLATAGEAGVGRALDIFKTEIDFALMLTGVPRLVDLDPSVVRQRSA